MKEPVECTEVEISNWREGETFCVECGDRWPCKKVQRWRTSKEYRIQQLETTVKNLGDTNRHLSERFRKLEGDYTRLNRMVIGQLPALADLLRGRTGGTLSHESTVDCQDFAMAGSTQRVRVAGPRDFNVTYTDADGSVWKNGDLIEKVYRKS